MLFGLCLTIALSLWAQTSVPPVDVRVPDAAAAIEIARRAAVKVYGKARIDRQEPLTAWLGDGVWFVRGTLWCDDPEHKGKRTRVGCVGAR
jgi:hypothetical protein